VEVRFNEFNLI